MKISQNIEGLFPFLILIGVSILKGLHKRAKEKKEKEKRGRYSPPLPAAQPKTAPLPLSTTKVKSVKLSEAIKKEVFQRKKKTRIGKLVSGLKSKKDLVLLSEILAPRSGTNFAIKAARIDGDTEPSTK